jgi:hypothetical protein
MSQDDVFQWLKDRRSSGDHSWFLPPEIRQGLKDKGLTNGALEHIRGDCFKLWMSGNGCLEMKDFDRKGITNWSKAFRIKKIYVEVYDGTCKN